MNVAPSTVKLSSCAVTARVADSPLVCNNNPLSELLIVNVAFESLASCHVPIYLLSDLPHDAKNTAKTIKIITARAIKYFFIFSSKNFGNGDKSKKFEQLNLLSQDSNRALADHIVTVKYNELLSLSKINGKVEITKDDIRKICDAKVDGVTPIEKNKGYEEVCKMLTLENIDKLARAEHRRWNIFHLTRGWHRRLDLLAKSTKTPKLKLHACIVEWEELDQISSAYNYNYKDDDIEAIFRIHHLHENHKSNI